MATFRFSVNNIETTVEADGATPLLYILRDELMLNGPRYGCGAEQCGACRVLIDGEPEYACTYRVDEATDKQVTTVEGLGSAGALHPLQQAFLEFNAAQCGYCASGIIVSAAALLERNKNPSRAEIGGALKGNLCRCGAHNRIINAVSRAAEIIREGPPR